MPRIALIIAIITNLTSLYESGIDWEDYKNGYELASEMYNGGYYAIRTNEGYKLRLHSKRWERLGVIRT